MLNSDTRRCIKPKECIKANRKIYEKQCLKECPPGYTSELSDNGTCKLCKDKCPKTCSYFHEIKTIGQLEVIGTGCTIINSSLEINIIDDVREITAELQTYLGNIEVGKIFINPFLIQEKSFFFVNLRKFTELFESTGKQTHMA